MRFYVHLFMGALALLWTFVTSQGIKPTRTYVGDPNHYNCEEEIIDYSLPVPLPTQTSRYRPQKSYVYYEPADEPVQEKYIVKLSPPKKYYNPYKKETSRFYQVLQPQTGEKYYEQVASAVAPTTQKPPAIQIYVV